MAVATPVFRPKAIRQIRGDVELAAAHVDLALGRFAERNDSRVQPVDQRAERQKIERAVLDVCSNRDFMCCVDPIYAL